jgi:hypothetical protein
MTPRIPMVIYVNFRGIPKKIPSKSKPLSLKMLRNIRMFPTIFLLTIDIGCAGK